MQMTMGRQHRVYSDFTRPAIIMGITEQENNYNSQCSLAQNSDVQPFGVSWEDIELMAKARKLIFHSRLGVGSGSGCGADRKGELSERSGAEP